MIARLMIQRGYSRSLDRNWDKARLGVLVIPGVDLSYWVTRRRGPWRCIAMIYRGR
jgi:hypothetical protein